MSIDAEQPDLFTQTENPNRLWVKDLEPGTDISGPFALTHMALKPYTGGKFLQVKLGDKTGRVAAVLWNGAEEVYPNLDIGDIVDVQGKVDTYRDKKQVVIRRIDRKEDLDSLDPNDFIAAVQADVKGIWEDLKSIARTVKDPHLLELLGKFFKDEAIVDAFLRAPGGKQWHHGYIGGLVEHTLGVVRNCVAIAEQYPFIKRDVLVTGAIFHDLGKILEFVYSTVIDYSDIGRLVGHQVLGDQKVCEYAQSIENFPPDLLLEVRHLILSHHGDSPDAVRGPQTREALILSRADDLDAQMNAFTREILKARMSGRKWSDYVNLIGRYLYDSGGTDEPEDLPGMED
ncbi:MAG: HD domain-containing protein [Candidatus Omnitrophica bacterium]|nr:HD domain-containing protein [Candidatus Omnitrophota bacterium]